SRHPQIEHHRRQPPSACHFAITHKPWVWTLVSCLHDFYQGASLVVWLNQHILGHHVYTNIDGADLDIATVSYRQNSRHLQPIIGCHGCSPYQVGPEVAAQILLPTHLHPTSVLRSNIRMNQLSNTQLFVFFAGKLFHCTNRFIIPWALHTLD
ncbi:Acyl-lipid (8-3)-desaturase, partial [Geodia barretti]